MTETLPDQVEHETPQTPLGTTPAVEAGEDFSWLDKAAEPIEAIDAESPAAEELAMEVEENAAEAVAEVAAGFETRADSGLRSHGAVSSRTPGGRRFGRAGGS